MGFTKYNSITNHYDTKYLRRYIDQLPDKVLMQVTEKLHGANFSIIAHDGKISFARRTAVLTENEKFYNYQNVMADPIYKPIFDKLLKYVYLMDFTLGGKSTLQLYGELFGGNIQKGVYYGDDKKFRWYALKCNDKFIPTRDVDVLLETIINFKVPVVSMMEWHTKHESPESFIDRIPYEFDSKFTPEGYEGDNMCEGVVAIPYDITPELKQAEDQYHYFAIKKKNKQFLDRSKQHKRVKVEKELPDDVVNMIEVFVSYVNENRTNDLMSKLGELDDIKRISSYAKIYFADVMSDFQIDNIEPWVALGKDYQKEVKRVASTAIFTELKRYLGGLTYL